MFHKPCHFFASSFRVITTLLFIGEKFRECENVSICNFGSIVTFLTMKKTSKDIQTILNLILHIHAFYLSLSYLIYHEVVGEEWVLTFCTFNRPKLSRTRRLHDFLPGSNLIYKVHTFSKGLCYNRDEMGKWLVDNSLVFIEMHM